MKAAELRKQLRNQTLGELKETLSASLRDQFKLNLGTKSGELTHPHRITKQRRDIARILTVIEEKRRVKS